MTQSSDGLLDAVQAVTARWIGVFRPLADGMRGVRSFAARLIAAEDTATALAGFPKPMLRALTVITVRCPSNELLLRVVGIPDQLPGAPYADYLVIPASGTTFRTADERVPMGRAWFLNDDSDSIELQCRCHPRPVTLTPQQLCGESSPPVGIRIQRAY